MQTTPLVIAIVCIVLFGILFTLLVRDQIKRSKKDWETLDDLENRVNKINTLEELKVFHDDFREKCKDIHNPYITPKLSGIDGYCRGLYKSFNKNK